MIRRLCHRENADHALMASLRRESSCDFCGQRQQRRQALDKNVSDVKVVCVTVVDLTLDSEKDISQSPEESYYDSLSPSDDELQWLYRDTHFWYSTKLGAEQCSVSVREWSLYLKRLVDETILVRLIRAIARYPRYNGARNG